ncbi:hypothetical protein HNO89_000455 [Sporosarcina luteola]|nr:hypothetical protein [Sporosarcina luteola]
MTAGKITIKQGVVTLSGNHSITMVADGYADSSVTQNIKAGDFVEANSSTSHTTIQPGKGPIVTLTARDQYNNLIPGYQFKLDVTITNNNPSTQENVRFNNVNYYSSIANLTAPSTVTATNGAEIGKAYVAIQVSLVDGGDSATITWKDAEGNVIFQP